MTKRGIGLAMAAVALAACSQGVLGNDQQEVRPSGQQGERSFANRGFDRLSVAGSDDVVVRTGPAFSIVARGDRAELDLLDVTQDGSTLRIGRRRGVRMMQGKGVTVTVTMPAVKAVSLAGSGDVSVDRVRGDQLALSIAGSGDLSVGQMAVRSADIGISGNGDMALAGTTERIAVSIRGSGDVDGGGLRTPDATVSVMGSGDVRLAVQGGANVTLAGSGDIDLGPQARCTTAKRGSGTVRCGG